MLEALHLGNEDEGMPEERSRAIPRRASYTRRSRTPRCEWCGRDATRGHHQGTGANGLPKQIGEGVESAVRCGRHAGISMRRVTGCRPPNSRRKEFEHGKPTLKHANEILKRAASFFEAELCATRRRVYREVVRDRLRGSGLPRVQLTRGVSNIRPRLRRVCGAVRTLSG